MKWKSSASRLHLGRERLSGRTGAGLDPCAALQTILNLGRTKRSNYLFDRRSGSNEEVRDVVSRFRGSVCCKRIIHSGYWYWDDMLGTIEVRTPDEALNTIVNRWLLYQTLACRVWATFGLLSIGRQHLVFATNCRT